MAAEDRDPRRLTLRLPRDVYEALVRAADADRRSLNAMAVVLIEEGCQRRHPDEGTDD